MYFGEPIFSLQDADPKTLQMMRNVCRTIRQFPEFVILGEMLNTPPLGLPQVTIAFNNRGKAKTIDFPAVLHRAWRSPSGDIACSLANIPDETQCFPLRMLPYGTTGDVDLVLYRNGGEAEELARNVRLPFSVDLQLAALDTAVLRVVSS